MSLIKEIIKDIVNEDVSLSTALRKAKILASILKSKEFQKWIDSELSGYKGDIEIPDYRKIPAQNFGIFSGPFRSMIKNVMIPTYNLPESIKAFAKEIIFPEGVKELESLADADGTLQRKWDAEAVILARDHISISGGYVLVDAWQPITKQVIEGILDNIKNRLLDFLLKLQEVDPSIIKSKDSIPNISKEEIRNVFNFAVYGNHNILSAGEDFIQEVNQKVIQNDLKSLISYLRNLNISEQDLKDLKKSIKLDGKRKNKQFGNKVKEWLGKMTIKAADGTWKVAIQTAAMVLTSALKNYYGW